MAIKDFEYASVDETKSCKMGEISQNFIVLDILTWTNGSVQDSNDLITNRLENIEHAVN